MIARCPYCEYRKPNVAIDRNMLLILADPNLPLEDYMLWIERIVTMHGLNDYTGIKIHIGIKHKNEFNEPMFELTKSEARVINAAKAHAAAS